MSLPEGVKEEVVVECNGVRGKFVPRCQKVIYNGALVPAARFEGFCGRGDAKKWKSSLWYVDETTNLPEVQMSVEILVIPF